MSKLPLKKLIPVQRINLTLKLLKKFKQNKLQPGKANPKLQPLKKWKPIPLPLNRVNPRKANQKVNLMLKKPPNLKLIL